MSNVWWNFLLMNITAQISGERTLTRMRVIASSPSVESIDAECHFGISGNQGRMPIDCTDQLVTYDFLLVLYNDLRSAGWL